MITRIITNLKEPITLIKKIVKRYKDSKKFGKDEKTYWNNLKDIHALRNPATIGY